MRVVTKRRLHTRSADVALNGFMRMITSRLRRGGPGVHPRRQLVVSGREGAGGRGPFRPASDDG